MSRFARWMTLVAASGLVMGCNSGDDGDPVYRSFESLNEALSDPANIGKTLFVGGTIEVDRYGLLLSRGMTIQGIDDDARIVTIGEVPAITLANDVSSSEAARIVHLSIESGARVAVEANGGGAGSFVMEDVHVVSRLGAGIVLEGLEHVEMTDVTVTGPVTAENVMDIPIDATGNETVTHGIAIQDVGDANVTDSAVSGIARYGVLLFQTATRWQGGAAMGNLNNAVTVWSGSADITGMEVGGTLRGQSTADQFAMVFGNLTSVTTTDVQISNNDAFGVIQDRSEVMHQDVEVSENTNTGLWVQDSPMFAVSGSASKLSRNRVAAIVALNATTVDVADAEISDTELGPMTASDGSTEMMGDGLQTYGVPNARVSRLQLLRNARVGALFDAAGQPTDGVVVSDVTIEGEGEQLGFVTQGADFGTLVSDGVTQDALTAANDSDFRDEGGVLKVADFRAPLENTGI